MHRLEGFYWVSLHSGYAAAARNFPYAITQPAVHQQVKKLEDELGCRLFERISKDRVRHTPQGRRLYEFCAPFFEQLPGVVRALRTGKFGGELRVDGSPLTMRRLLPVWIRRLREQIPTIDVVLSEQPSTSLDRLRTGEADLVIDHFDVIPEGVEFARVGTAYAYLVVVEGHKAATRKKTRPALVGGETFIAFPADTRRHAQQMSSLEHLEVNPGRLLFAPAAETILSYVAAGLGFTILPWLDKQGPEHPGVTARRLKTHNLEWAIKAAYRPGPSVSPLVRDALACAPVAKKHR